MRTFFISDIHGNFCGFKNLLDHVRFDPENDQLVIGGDMINRGSRSAIVLQWVKEHVERYPENVHVLAGNHEEMMIWFMKELSPIWMEFGGDETIKNFKKVYGEENGWPAAERYAAWLETLPLIYEDENGIYVHAGIDITADQMNQPRDIVWLNRNDLRETNEQALRKWTNGKIIFRGHNPVASVHKEGQFVHCDLGSGMLEDQHAALALVEVQRKRYFRCDMDGEISVHTIKGMDSDN